ncbi:hypothetical protein [Isorropodon fossajaponicum symbiont]|uniref:hypothetical protein n=1 Tax=Isorropodon fossajaponicum symbiont TaxID=883811 RepID=UPI0019158682|nr:hypothetical protein [Isorropodon fossajaponicum symbiont]
MPFHRNHKKPLDFVELRRICLYRAHSFDKIRHNIDQGTRLELNRGASGRIILAYGQRKNDPSGFFKNIRDKGYYVSVNEHNISLFAISIPVIADNGHFVGALPYLDLLVVLAI